MKRRVFISVYDKSGLVDFAKNLIEKFNYEIVAANDTYEFLKESGVESVNVTEFSSISGFLSTNYDSLNETILAGILADSTDAKELNDLEKLVVKAFDMVVVNLCPIEKIINENSNIEEITSQIDIAGFTLLRAAAKNYKHVTVISDKIDYYVALNSNDFGRQKLALKAFNLTSNYDRAICSVLAEETGDKPFKSFNFEKVKDLPYGENPHQKAAVYRNERMVDYEVLNDKELTYNNILNITEAVNIVSEFYDVNCAAMVRHGKPCGVALGRSMYEAYTKSFDCDPVSSFYGIAGFSKTVDEEIARHLNSMAVEVVIAPDYTEGALETFKDNPEIKVVKINTSLKEYRRLNIDIEEVTITPFGTLVQGSNNSELDKDMFQVVTKEKPTAEQIEDAIFAWKVVKHAKTSAVVIARDFKTSAIAQGQTNSLAAVDYALNYACDNAKEAVMASDSVLPSEDSIYAAVQSRVSLIIQPGGCVKDQSLIDLCDKYGIAMITTGVRNYRH